MNRKELVQAYMEQMGAMRRLMHRDMPVLKGMKSLPTHAQMGVLITVSQEGPRNIRELAERFCMSSSAVTQTVNALVRSGILRRKENPLDRRQMLVSLTPRGVRTLALAKMHRVASLEAMLKPLSETELAQLVAIYRKVTSSLSPSAK